MSVAESVNSDENERAQRVCVLTKGCHETSDKQAVFFENVNGINKLKSFSASRDTNTHTRGTKGNWPRAFAAPPAFKVACCSYGGIRFSSQDPRQGLN